MVTANQLSAQEIWRESFSEPEKGIWGDGNGNIVSDFSGTTTWSLEYNSVEVANADDYAKTVTTSGGRFEVRDITGEVTWRSEWIDISVFREVKTELTAKETGSGANEENKYLKVFYRIDNNEEVPFEVNAENSGNWGTVYSSQSGIKGQSLQVVVKMANNYSGDKVILDEVIVAADIRFELPLPGDVLLNEILFNPVPGGADYVEVINVSEKLLSLKNLYIASRDNNSELTQIYRLSENDLPFEPENYVSLTKDTTAVFPWFFIECAACFRQMEKFPSFNNDEDVVVLLNESMEIIDEFHYNDDMHSSFLHDVEGVSLERISMETPTNATGNWFSASSEAGYGTPGYKNSQAGTGKTVQPKVTFKPEAFSPNMDGYNDEYHIQYELNEPGYLANARIFDAAGRLVMQLANNEILSTSGEITWNGEDETGQKQPLGMYIIAVEIFNSKGNVYRFKDGVVLTDVLE
ncbi:MAG: gliding motility-associated C-terminal domain-containing protein [Prolixibacteraceae bacterium]